MTKDMEDGEVELSDQTPISDASSFTNLLQGSASANTFFDEFLKNIQTCSHTHTCNPPAIDASTHTHTCHHTHTQLITSGEDDTTSPKENSCSIQSRRRNSGNREAVRKYREKKKARSAYLEEEVNKLRFLNQQLVKKLQGQVSLEAEVARLRSLLFDLRGKFDTELGLIPTQKQICSSSTFRDLGDGDCRIQHIALGTNPQCEISVPCLHPSPFEVGFSGNSNLAANWGGMGSQAHKDDADMNTSPDFLPSLPPIEYQESSGRSHL